MYINAVASHDPNFSPSPSSNLNFIVWYLSAEATSRQWLNELAHIRLCSSQEAGWSSPSFVSRSSRRPASTLHCGFVHSCHRKNLRFQSGAGVVRTKARSGGNRCLRRRDCSRNDIQRLFSRHTRLVSERHSLCQIWTPFRSFMLCGPNG